VTQGSDTGDVGEDEVAVAAGVCEGRADSATWDMTRLRLLSHSIIPKKPYPDQSVNMLDTALPHRSIAIDGDFI
jgi:hypothetical protein